MPGTLTWGELSLGEVLRLLPFESYFPIIFPFRASKRNRVVSHCTSSLQAKTNFKYKLNAMSFILYSIPLLTQLSRQRDVWNWTEKILLPTLYNLPSYNYTGKAPKFIEGESGLVVGVARFRQHRVKKGKEDTL